ncbi:MAG: MerR family transcriptional regulator [Candidatus Omnitrophota bacterium]
MGLITSRELVRRHNISYQTLNFYTTLGLFQINGRIGHRRFYDEDIVKSRLERILALKGEGYPLKIINKYLSDARSAESPKAGVLGTGVVLQGRLHS